MQFSEHNLHLAFGRRHSGRLQNRYTKVFGADLTTSSLYLVHELNDSGGDSCLPRHSRRHEVPVRHLRYFKT